MDLEHSFDNDRFGYNENATDCRLRFDGLPLGEGACSFLLSLSPSDIHLSSFGPTSCDNDVPEDVFLCSSYVDEMGAFPSMLPVLLCRLISECAIKSGVFAIVDDVNPGGYTLLLEKQ